MRRALVVGCSAGVWRDVERAREIGEYEAVYCVKHAGVHWPAKFQVWVTLHPEFMDKCEEERRSLGLPDGYEIVAPPPAEVGMHGAKGRIARRVSYRWPGMKSSASSGVYAAKVALDDGFDRVVLAGVPMTVEDGHFLPHTRNGQGHVRGSKWSQHSQFLPGLTLAMPHMRGKVRSVSGKTMELLGVATPEWLSTRSERAELVEGRQAQNLT